MDHTLKVWDLKTGCELRTLQGHSDRVNGVAASPDGRLIVSASGDSTLKVWDLETGGELRTLQGHSHDVNGVAVSPDGRFAVSASVDKTLKVWDLETGGELRTLQGHSYGVNGVAVSPDGRLAVSASFDFALKVWDLEHGTVTATFTCDAAARCCAFIDNRRIIAGDEVGRVHFLTLELEQRDDEPGSSSPKLRMKGGRLSSVWRAISRRPASRYESFAKVFEAGTIGLRTLLRRLLGQIDSRRF